MNTDVFLQRARLLVQQNRQDQAVESLRQVLSQDPNCAEAHALLAVCFLQNKDKWHDATREAEQAVGLEPDNPFNHYVLGLTHEQRNRFPEALASVDSALALDAGSSHFYSLKASILMRQKKWNEALEAAETGLAVDAEDESCASIRAVALERLGRGDASIAQADQAVSHNPDSTYAHCTRGWTLLNNGQYRQAAEAFRESLRLGPTNESARIGMIQALNNHFFLFRIVFRFYAFLGRMAQGAQWAIIIGLFVGMRALNAFAAANPAWKPYVTPISILYLAFCLLSWVATPLFNTFLRFHPFGKYLLSAKEKWASNLIAALVVMSLAGVAFQLVRGDTPLAILTFLVPLFLTLPISSAFSVDEGWPRYAAAACAIGIGLLALTTYALLLVDGAWEQPYLAYIGCILVYSFLGNYLSSVTVRR